MSAEHPQTSSHYPAIPPPIEVHQAQLPNHVCPYLPGRTAGDRAIWAGSIPADLYERFMDCGFRRSGKLLYQPACRGCRACQSLRVPVEQFVPSKSQRRCLRRNEDLQIAVGPPNCSEEKFALYRRYITDWHGRSDPEDASAFESFLYDSPVETTIEFEYRDSASRLLAVGICDVCPACLSSVYFYFDPAERRRGLGTYGALREIEFAGQMKLPYYYLGYYVRGCGAMEYKASFRPSELLDPDGVWRPHAQDSATEGLRSQKLAVDQNVM
jgi:arginyl-tRNA--protein-N-Asp/Glu arginylyltransferase